MSFPLFSPGSPVIRLNATNRLLHIPIVESITYADDVSAFDFYSALGHFLALKHFNDRNPVVVPDLPAALQGCDILLTTEIYDARYDIQLVSSIISSLLQRENNALESPIAGAVVGGGYSSEAKPAAILTGIYQVPMISGGATSSELDNHDVYPTFARVVPKDAGNAIIMVNHFRSLGVKHFGVLYPRNEFGVNYNLDIRREAARQDMQVMSISFDILDTETKPGSINEALAKLKNSGYNYFFGIPLLGGVEEEILREAYRAGIAGPGFAWFIQDFTLGELALDHDDRELIDALNGLGALILDPDVPPSMEESLMQFQMDQALQNEFISYVKNVDKRVFVDFNLTKEEPIYSFWTALAYDAILLPAHAACSINKEFFSREDLFESLSNISFQGSTGKILLSKDSQTRDPYSINTHLLNIFIDKNISLDGRVRFETQKIDFADSHNHFDDGHGDFHGFRYADNSTTPPFPLPNVEVNMNLISDASRIAGLVLCGLVIVVALGCIIFTFLFRRAKYIRGSQPPFLYMLCIGVIIMAVSIIPMSFQEPMPATALNVACMSQLWLISVGFTTTFSALFCKVWRLNQLLENSNRFRRVNVHVTDVLYPFVILLSLNILLLSVWTASNPLVWSRSEDLNPIYSGEVMDTVGGCASSSEGSDIAFFSAFAVLNFAALICANWQCYKARKLNSEFSEVANIGLSMMLMTEAAVMGAPILFLVADDPSALFLVRSILIAIISFAVMMPIFVPKVALRDKEELDSPRIMRSSYVDEGDQRSSSRSWWGSDDELNDGLVSRMSTRFLKRTLQTFSLRQSMPLDPPDLSINDRRSSS